MNALVDLELLVRSRYPIIAVETWEEDRLQSTLRQIGSRLKLHVYDWTVGNPVRRLGALGDDPQGTQTPLEALRSVASLGDGIFHFKDLYRFFGEPPVVRRLLELAPSMEHDRRSVVLSAPQMTLPAELEKRSAFFRFALPSADELKTLAKGVVDSLRRDHKQVKVEITDVEFDQLVDRLRGMTLFEAEKVVTSAVLRDFALTKDDLAFVVEMKKELLAKDGVLEFMAPEGALDGVGGFQALKTWLGKRRRAFTPEAKEFGIVWPKGILLLGCQGCGKTLVAKSIAQDWGLPLLKMEPGKLYDKFIGESEKNFEKAIAVAEGMAPCVLMIDEIEKGFASVSSSESDGGLSRRIFGRLLGWLQDRKAPVFVVATSNDIEQLPPEMVRKGRFDEIFFIDLPTGDERQQIFSIHLKKRKRDPARFDLAALAAASDGFSGAEIE
ncbi:MAG: AAA family ATPase, partial [Candidatus Rokubacteria bacterium]|nr:AAA family ATPase [Candidatus Rokubacteria bacterium]